jgi:hypothetical protein
MQYKRGFVGVVAVAGFGLAVYFAVFSGKRSDQQRAADMVGTWQEQFQNSSGGTTTVTFEFTRDGGFEGWARDSGFMGALMGEVRGEGRWWVNEGVLETRITRLKGGSLGSMLYGESGQLLGSQGSITRWEIKQLDKSILILFDGRRERKFERVGGAGQ